MENYYRITILRNKLNALSTLLLNIAYELSFEQIILTLLKPKEPFHILAHSLGTVVALEVASLLEKLGHQGKIFLIDGSPLLLKMLEGLSSASNRENFVLENALRIWLYEAETRKIMVSNATETIKLY